ncbi:phosphodiester glycosidase family protein [Kitasatospora purpeofusca]|uniref:phosphodiester glycosidase family protein n=1 Tax=Kitasatospora purpeofusca TaxID=67352 RepID=UPI002A59CC74|nr:phosphodiester glycosidase family protein [Kitasatospora purpeofusca]MDY0811761.1 phosphodiester glycosidase family protein [Kitasatospora purpeofusca]
MRTVAGAATALALITLALGTPPAHATRAVHAAPAGSDTVHEQVAPGVEYQAFTLATPRGTTRVHVVTAHLDHPAVTAGLLHPGAVAARLPVSRMAQDAGAVAAVNGDFFNISEEQHPGVQATGAPCGPVVLDGLAVKAAVPTAQRFGWELPAGGSVEDVLGVGLDGRARTGRLALDGRIRTPDGVRELGGLNQYALPVGSVGAFTARWGQVSRARAACGSDERRADPCTTDTYEVTVREGHVVAVSDTPGSGAVPSGDTVLLGREAGARYLRELTPGAPVDVDYRLDAGDTPPFAFALGAHPLLQGREPLPGLDEVTAEPRTAAGIADGGRTLHLLATDGRNNASTGLTLGELARLLRSLGSDEGSYLDGGGSSTLATTTDTGHVGVRNALDHQQERAVPNGIAITARPEAPEARR